MTPNRRTFLKGFGIAATTTTVPGGAIAGGSGARQTGKFRLEGTARLGRDPWVRPVNHVVEIETDDDGEYGSTGRPLDVSALPELDGRLGLDANVVSGDTITSAPRIILSVDTSGDGEHDEWIFGFHQDLGAGIADQGWTSIDFTDAGSRWNTSRIGGSGTYVTWSTALDDWDETYDLRTGWVVDDGHWDDTAAGVLHLDSIQIGNRVLDGPEDTVGRIR